MQRLRSATIWAMPYLLVWVLALCTGFLLGALTNDVGNTTMGAIGIILAIFYFGCLVLIGYKIHPNEGQS